MPKSHTKAFRINSRKRSINPLKKLVFVLKKVNSSIFARMCGLCGWLVTCGSI
jgi:hypothetical protein